MLGLTRKTDYALVALARLSQQGEADGSRRERLSAREIAEQYSLPTALLMNVLKDLQRAGIVASVQGPRGGYYLNRDVDDLSILQVIEATEGPLNLTACCGDTEAEPCMTCQILTQCPVSEPIQKLNDKVLAFLEGVKLNQLMGEAGPADANAIQQMALAG